MQLYGDVIVEGPRRLAGQVFGLTTVRPGGRLESHGQLMGDLIIEAGGTATVHGQISGDVFNRGEFILHGQILGKLIGLPPIAGSRGAPDEDEIGI